MPQPFLFPPPSPPSLPPSGHPPTHPLVLHHTAAAPILTFPKHDGPDPLHELTSIDENPISPPSSLLAFPIAVPTGLGAPPRPRKSSKRIPSNPSLRDRTQRPAHHRHRTRNHSSISSSVASIEIVRSTLRKFRTTISPSRFGDVQVIRPPSKVSRKSVRYSKVIRAMTVSQQPATGDALGHRDADSAFTGPGSTERPSTQTADESPHMAAAAHPLSPTLHVVHPSTSTTQGNEDAYGGEPVQPAPRPFDTRQPRASSRMLGDMHPFAAVVHMMEQGAEARQSATASPQPPPATVEAAASGSKRWSWGRDSAKAEQRVLTPELRSPGAQAGPSGRRRQRRNFMGPTGVINQITSQPSLRRLTPSAKSGLAAPSLAGRAACQPTIQAGQGPPTTYVRTAPLPPTHTRHPTPTRFAPAFQPGPTASPTPTATPHQSRGSSPHPDAYTVFAAPPTHSPGGISPTKSSIWLKNGLLSSQRLADSQGPRGRRVQQEAEEGMVEIPRFKKRELNLGIVGNGSGQRIAWGSLWFAWILWGLLSIFFDVNILYMLVQCAQHPSIEPDATSTRTWTFGIAAYAVCWGISIFGVWLGWEVWYEFWRRWRLPRPAIEPIHTSLAASLHLSLISFEHFTFFTHVRTSPLGSQHAKDIIPDTAHLLVQTLPGLAPVLPRAGLAVVLLVGFWSGSGDSLSRDVAFWTLDGALTLYAKGVSLAFVSLTALRLVIVITASLTLFAFAKHTSGRTGTNRSRLSRLASISSFVVPPRASTPPPIRRDPATAMSPSKGWFAEADLQWDWRERSRNRLQDGFELCMIRKHSTLGRNASTRSAGRGNGSTVSPRGDIPMSNLKGTDYEKSSGGYGEAVVSPTSADPFVRLETPRPSFTAPAAPSTTPPTDSSLPSQSRARPESTLDPTASLPVPAKPPPPPTPDRQVSSATLDPRSALGRMPAARQSSSSQDLFYTPMSHTPVTERTISHATLQPVGASPAGTFGTERDASGVNSISGSGAATPTPPSAYKRPANPAPAISGTSPSSTTHALNIPVRRSSLSRAAPHSVNCADDENGSAEVLLSHAEPQAESGEQSRRFSTSTTDTERSSIADDSTALLSHDEHTASPGRRSSQATITASQSSHSHSHHSPGSRRASIVTATPSATHANRNRSRSASFASRLRDRSASLVSLAGGRSISISGNKTRRRASYSHLASPGLGASGAGPVTEFGSKIVQSR